MLDELLVGGEMQETSKKNVLKAIAAQDVLQEVSMHDKSHQEVFLIYREYANLCAQMLCIAFDIERIEAECFRVVRMIVFYTNSWNALDS